MVPRNLEPDTMLLIGWVIFVLLDNTPDERASIASFELLNNSCGVGLEMTGHVWGQEVDFNLGEFERLESKSVA